MKCEQCGKEHDGSYGSGRFCSDHCRRVYSGKRVNINGNQKCNFNYNNVRYPRAQYGTWKCRFCNLIFNTKHELYEHYHSFHKNEMQIWNKGKTKDTDIRLKLAGEKRHNKYVSGELIPSFIGKHHSIISKQKMSKSALASKHQRICKKTEPYLKADGTIVNLDSSYERKLAKIFDDHNIIWIRPKPLIWIDKENIQHHYFPDFYLKDYDIYLDPKNEYCFKVQKEKIDYIKAHYSNCYFLTNSQLTWEYIQTLLF